jgi:hypothetical protein
MIIIIIIKINNIIQNILIYKLSYIKKIILRVKFHLKYIIHIIVNEEIETILYQTLN